MSQLEPFGPNLFRASSTNKINILAHGSNWKVSQDKHHQWGYWRCTLPELYAFPGPMMVVYLFSFL